MSFRESLVEEQDMLVVRDCVSEFIDAEEGVFGVREGERWG